MTQYEKIKNTLKNWRGIVWKYQKPNARKAVVQMLNSFLPFLAIAVLMFFSLNWSYLITLALAPIAALFLVRIFIIQHDCGHQSFLKSKKWNDIIGLFSSFFSTIPYKYWSESHTAHHAHNRQLEHRGLGDIHFLTTEEYKNRSWIGKFAYRVFRNPWVQFVIVPIVYLAVVLRYPFTRLKSWKKLRGSFFINNLLVLGFYVGLAMLVGWVNLLMVIVPILVVFGTVAFWFFYVQHQHENNYNQLKKDWDHLLASVSGSTYYKLPRLFQWFTGNIGFHHVHHLHSRIPNYNLEACVKENPQLTEFVSVLTFRQSLKLMRHKLWDAKQSRMIGFREYRRQNRANQIAAA